jgi:hypothetical protein
MWRWARSKQRTGGDRLLVIAGQHRGDGPATPATAVPLIAWSAVPPCGPGADGAWITPSLARDPALGSRARKTGCAGSAGSHKAAALARAPPKSGQRRTDGSLPRGRLAQITSFGAAAESLRRPRTASITAATCASRRMPHTSLWVGHGDECSTGLRIYVPAGIGIACASASGLGWEGLEVLACAAHSAWPQRWLPESVGVAVGLAGVVVPHDVREIPAAVVLAL